jgi:4-amino-4-deoxy-L-arabinose transferase-like glycosyltransferase
MAVNLEKKIAVPRGGRKKRPDHRRPGIGSPSRMSSRFWTLAGIGLICLFCLQSLWAIPQLSATFDEAVHVVAGYSYWQTRDFRVNPEHPPLAKLIAALPLLAIKPALDTSSKAWTTPEQYTLAFTFLYGNNADRLLFRARLSMIALSGLGALITFLWARDLFGAMAGTFAVGLYSFCPNLLAHGMLITTDVPVATFTLLTLYLFWRQGDRPGWRSSLVIGLALGAAMATKYSGGLLPILIAGLSVVRALRQKDRRQALIAETKSLAIMAAVSVFVLEAAYLFSASPLLYFRNSLFVNANHDPSYQYYLLGELRQGGWWYYFLLAFAFKSTLPSLIFLVLRILKSVSGLIQAWGETILLAGIVFYFVVMSIGAHNLGVRYVLPAFPLIYIWVSGIVPAWWKNPFGRLVLVTLLGWQMWAAVSSFPNYIPYFNELVGGPKKGPDLLDDSNVDWGASLKQAAAYVKQKEIGNVVFSPFSAFDNPAYYGLTSTIRGPKDLVFKTPPSGTYIVSAHNIAWMRAVDPNWRRYEPVDRIGGYWVYRF